MADRIVISIRTERLEALIRSAPNIARQEIRRGLSRTLSAFARQFAQEMGIRVHRRIARKAAGRGRVSIPAKLRALGFSARVISRADDIRAKFSSSAPHTLAHERGATIHAKRGGFLVLKKRGRGGAGTGKPQVIARVRKVTLRPRLGFLASFRRAQGMIQGRLAQIPREIVRRMSRGR